VAEFIQPSQMPSSVPRPLPNLSHQRQANATLFTPRPPPLKMDGKTVPDATPLSRIIAWEALKIQYSNQGMQAPKYPFDKPCRASGTRHPAPRISFSTGRSFKVLALSLHLLSEGKTINCVFDHSQCILPRPPSRLTLPNLAITGHAETTLGEFRSNTAQSFSAAMDLAMDLAMGLASPTSVFSPYDIRQVSRFVSSSLCPCS
jgi:hypothetical protein